MHSRFRPSRRKADRQQRPKTRLSLESLESRRLLATLVVNSTLDAVDANPGDGLCEISSGGPCTLRAAIQEANALDNTDGPDRITIPAGTYTLSIEGIDEQLASTGDLDIREDLTVEGSGSENTIIDAAGVDRVFDITRGNVAISGLTIRGGQIQDDTELFEGIGGGIRNEDNLTLVDSIVTGNVATVGAGVGNYNGTLRIMRSVISGNGNASTIRGGGVSNYANYDPAILELSDTTISGNQAESGGGIENHTYDGMATATVTRSTISGNTADDGGGLSNRTVVSYAYDASATLTIRGSTISGNVAGSSGGGIHNRTDVDGTAVVNIANSTIASNTATAGDGGGLADIMTQASQSTIQSVIVSGNEAGGVGPDVSSDTVSASFSLIENPLGHSIMAGDNRNFVGQNPLLGPLESNGGLTMTHSLLTGSPVIDQGSNPESTPSDQRGGAFLRTIDNPAIVNASDGTDIGAVEVGQMAATHDYGDAPDGLTVGNSLRRYPTLLASNGARHLITTDGPTLGSLAPDAEPDGQPSVAASGDDLVEFDDEDGIGATAIEVTPGMPLTGIRISHDGGSGGALLYAWIDLNLDGDWDDSGEQILAGIGVPSGMSSTSLDGVQIPATATTGTTFIRTRISTVAGLTPRGEAIDGEVEDFLATIGTPPPQVADLSITHTVDQINPTLGQQPTFTITLTNDGPDRATNVEVSEFLPLDLIFVRSTVTQGTYDDFDGIWNVGNINSGDSAVLTVTATVDGTDTIEVTAEVLSSDQNDPDSTPGNAISGEDDEATIALSTCLTGGPLHAGMNQLQYSCAAPGSIVAFVRGTQRGTRTFEQHRTTVDIANAEEFALAIADANGLATALLRIDETELTQAILVQAYEVVPGSAKSNTLSLEASAQMLRATRVGSGGIALQENDLAQPIAAAITHWTSTGISDREIELLSRAHVTIGDLPSDAVGQRVGNTIVLDRDAAGNGWFVDDTPNDDSEFTAHATTSQLIAIDPDATGRIDLLTTLIHEFGHMLDLPDLWEPANVMHAYLAQGVRKLPTSNTNSTLHLDVNGDNRISALDALIVINRLNSQSVSDDSNATLWLGTTGPNRSYLDTNGDFELSALDALLVINQLSKNSQ